jgi:hypothetical protein
MALSCQQARTWPVIAGDEELSTWYSAPYMDRDFGFEQVKALIDSGGLK